TGINCFETAIVSGYNLVPDPPARMIPFLAMGPKPTRNSRHADMFSSLAEDIVQHAFSEPSGLRVLLAGMVRRNHDGSAIENGPGAVPKFRRWRWILPSEFLPGRKVGLEPNRSQRHNDAHALEPLQFFQQIRPAVRKLGRQRLVVWRSTMDGRSHITIHQPETVLGIHRLRLIRKAKSMKCPIQPIAGAIARKDAAGAVPAMCGRRQSNDQQPRFELSQTGNGLSPVFPIAKATDFVARNLFAIMRQPLASPAFDNFGLCRDICHKKDRWDLRYHRTC